MSTRPRRPGKQGHAAHEPRSSRKLVTEVPLTGLSLRRLPQRSTREGREPPEPLPTSFSSGEGPGVRSPMISSRPSSRPSVTNASSSGLNRSRRFFSPCSRSDFSKSPPSSARITATTRASSRSWPMPGSFRRFPTRPGGRASGMPREPFRFTPAVAGSGCPGRSGGCDTSPGRGGRRKGTVQNQQYRPPNLGGLALGSGHPRVRQSDAAAG